MNEIFGKKNFYGTYFLCTFDGFCLKCGFYLCEIFGFCEMLFKSFVLSLGVNFGLSCFALFDIDFFIK